MRRCFPFLSLIGVFGCGGGGDHARPTSEGTRALVAETLRDAQSALGHSSFQASFLPIFSIDTGTEPLLPPDVGNVLGGAPEDPIPSFYYSEGVAAWIQVTRTEFSYREDYYLDEAKTRPAGFYEDGDAGERYEFTAGPYAGARGRWTWTSQDLPGEDRDVSRATYRRVAPDGTVFAGDFAYVGLAMTFKGTTIHPDGKQDTFDLERSDENASRLVFRSGRGTILVGIFPDDFRPAKGTIRGAAAGFDATFAIDADGNMTVRFADGTTQAFGRGLRRAASRKRAGR